MKVLIGCERSGIIRDAFLAVGCDAWSCDLEPCEGNPERHIIGDVLSVANPEEFDLFGVHPECRYLSVSGIHWNHRRPERAALTQEALAFARQCFDLCSRFKYSFLENPVSILSSQVRKPDQIIQPYNFGEDASKQTCLWLHNLTQLKSTQYIEPRIVEGRKRWANQTDSGQNKLGPSPTRSMDRARTYPGIARAMAEQWGRL